MRIAFGDLEVYPLPLATDDLQRLAAVMRAEQVRIAVDLGCGAGEATVWSCDLSAGYVSINADYST